jgi:outer membrane lipoprotein-sorting protein
MTPSKIDTRTRRNEIMTHATRWTRNASMALAILMLTAAAEVVAQAPGDRGQEIAAAADARDTGWRDDRVTMTMTLRNRAGQESTRALHRLSLEVEAEGEGDRSLIVFEAPRDVEGTALLSHARILEPDDQWLWLPALKRVKRISSGNRSGPFVGSEFAYEDLVAQEVEKFDYRWIRDEECGDLQCAVVERTPRYEGSGYTRQVVWWDLEEYRVQRIEYYDRKDAHLKTLVYDGYSEHDGFWRPVRMRMENHQNGKSTELVFDGWTFGTGIDEAEFTAARLRGGR